MTTDPIYANLNEPQRQAVEHTDGPLLILAGAGSGKTRALTHRIARLMRDGVQPWQILAVTFTNKAANEMKERVKNMLSLSEGETIEEFNSKSAKLPVMGTFHSVCARILRRDIEHLGRDRTFVIYDKDDQVRLMKEILKEMQIDVKELKPKAVLSHVGRFKCEAVLPKQAAVEATTDRMEKIITAYTRYQNALKEANALDFDDLILEVIRLFQQVPDVLEKYQRTWKYLHVDEYQDTNHSQYLLITLLAKGHQNLCVIGDPDQSIYAFRGADIRNILEFNRDYPDAVEIKLEQNYRSTQPILDSADRVIAANPNRPAKKMWTEKTDGPTVIVHELSDEKAEATHAIQEAKKLTSQGISLSQQVILYRTNAQSRLFEEACLRTGTPYRILGGMKFYARREVKDVLAYLHVILNPRDTVSLLRIINIPSRKLGLTTLSKIQAHSTANNLNLWECLTVADQIEGINEATAMRIGSFSDLIERFREKMKSEPVADLTAHLLSAINMEEWVKDDTEEGEQRWGNILELQSVMHKYDHLAPEESLISFLEEVALVSEVDKLDGVQGDALTLMTLHLCKGLEFEHVMIAGCEEGIFPHSNAMFDKESLEEERRLMYVGMTRAKQHLQMLFAGQRMLWGETQANCHSRFLDDLPDEVERRSDDVLSAFAWAGQKGAEQAMTGDIDPDEHDVGDVEFDQDISFEQFNQDTFAEGTKINHPTFGNGTIVAKRGDIVEVQFEDGTRKSLALSIAPLRPL